MRASSEASLFLTGRLQRRFELVELDNHVAGACFAYYLTELPGNHKDSTDCVTAKFQQLNMCD